MAEPKTKYEYGSTPEQEQGGIWPLLSQLGGLFTPERREVITPSKTTYTDIDGVYFPNTTSGVYGPVERGVEYMPVVQGAKSAYEFLGDLISSGKKRGETADALVKGIGTLIEDQKRAGINAAMTGQTSFYDPEKKREVAYDPYLIPASAAVAAAAFPVKGPGAVLGMFAGRNAATADLDALKVAEKMETKGHSRDEILDQTGWFRYQDREGKPMGKWKFETPDDASVAVTDTAALKPYLTETGRVKKGSGQTGYGPEIDKLLVHDKLYKAYPGNFSPEKALAEVIRDISNINEATKKLQVKYGRGELTEPAFRQQYNLLLQQKSELQDLMQKGFPISAVPGGPAKTVREQYPLLDRPIGDTVVVRTTPGGDMEDALGYYKPRLNVMALLRKQDSYPITNQPSLSSEYLDSYFKAKDAFRDAGLFLSGDVFEGKVKYSVESLQSWQAPYRKSTADPKNLPDNLKKQLDQLQDDTPKQLRDMSLERFRSTALHELQHAVQRREGFETGGMPEEFGKGFKNRPVDPKTGKQLTPFQTYENLVGETEARLVEKRMDMTPAERRFVPPYSQVDESMMYTRKDLGVDRGDSSSLNNAPIPKTPESRELRGKLFQELANKQRGTPEIAMVEAQGKLGGGVLSYAIEHVGDLTHRMTDKYDNFKGYGYDVGNKVDRVLRSLRSEYGFEKEFNENIRAASSYRGIPENRFKDTATKALQRYADAHKNLRVYNEPQKLARDAAVALGEQRFTDAREHLSKLQNLIKGDGGTAQSGENISDAYRRAAGEFDPNFEDLGVKRKASGGMVDKPLYGNARVIG